MPFSPLFWGEGFTTKIDKTEKQSSGTLLLSSLIWRKILRELQGAQKLLGDRQGFPPAGGPQLFGYGRARSPSERLRDQGIQPKNPMSQGFNLSKCGTEAFMKPWVRSHGS